MAYPVAPKTSAAGVSAAVSGAALYLLQVYVFKGVVPPGVESLIYAAVPGVVAFAAAYAAPHQPRPADAPVPARRYPPGAMFARAAAADKADATGNVTVLPAEERLAVPGDPEPPPGM